MPSVGHLAVGLAAGRVRPAPSRVRSWVWTCLLVVLSYLPDADVLAFRSGIPYGAPFGHRGAFHSLAFACLVACALGLAARVLKLPAFQVTITAAVVMGSHGVLDTLTDGGRGIALLWPFANARYFAPWRPIPVAPIGLGAVSVRGLGLMAHETVLFLPLFVVGLWPRARGPRASEGGAQPSAEARGLK